MNKKLTVLVAEDSEDDLFFLENGFAKLGLAPEGLRVVRDGEAALSYLKGEGEYGDRAKHPFPDFFLSDVKMPRMTGLEVLAWMREHPECRVIPTLILSNSDQTEDVKRAYDLGAQAYLVKPSGRQEFNELLRYACEFWKWCAKPPPAKQRA